MDNPNHFDKIPFLLILKKPVIAKIKEKDKMIATSKKPKGLRASNSIGIPPLNDISNHLVMWLTQIAPK